MGAVAWQGEMLFDRGTTYVKCHVKHHTFHDRCIILIIDCCLRDVRAKSKPWSSASSVPLICAGPGIARGAVVHDAVSTVDLGPTFLDFAGVLDAAPPGMSRFSLRGVMQTPQTVAPPRKTVEFGLNNFRGVVQTINATHIFKFFCCSAAGGGCPGSTSADRFGFGNATDEFHLFNVVHDRFETPSSELRHSYRDIVEQMVKLLPPKHETSPNPHTSIRNQGYGYRWPGCAISEL